MKIRLDASSNDPPDEPAGDREVKQQLHYNQQQELVRGLIRQKNHME